MSPVATPLSMMSALRLGRYSEAMVATSWSTTTAGSGRPVRAAGGCAAGGSARRSPLGGGGGAVGTVRGARRPSRRTATISPAVSGCAVGDHRVGPGEGQHVQPPRRFFRLVAQLRGVRLDERDDGGEEPSASSVCRCPGGHRGRSGRTPVRGRCAARRARGSPGGRAPAPPRRRAPAGRPEGAARRRPPARDQGGGIEERSPTRRRSSSSLVSKTRKIVPSATPAASAIWRVLTSAPLSSTSASVVATSMARRSSGRERRGAAGGSGARAEGTPE